MKALARLPAWLAALWWGSLSAVGFLVVPLLFAHLPTPAIAGAMAAKLFSAQNWLSVICGLLLLMITLTNIPPAHKQRVQEATIFIVLGMLLALLSEFAVAPRIVARESLRLWHSIGSLLYLLQWACAAVTFSRVVPLLNPTNQV